MPKKRKFNPNKFAQANRGQKISYRWTVRKRKIDGKDRYVRIRRIKGKIEMQVLNDLRYTEKKPKKKVRKRVVKPKPEKPKIQVKPKVQKKTKPKKVFLSQKEQIKMLEDMGKKFGKEDFDEINVLEYEEHHLGLIDPYRISLLTTNQGMEDSYLSKSVKDNKLIKVDWDNQEFSLSTGGKTISLEEGCSYDLERIQRALKSLDNPEIYCSKNKPLLIKDKNFSYVIAPIVEEKGFDEEGYPSEVKESGISSVMISPQEYKKYRKMTKKELLEKLGVDYDPAKKGKDELIIDLVKKNIPKPKPKPKQKPKPKEYYNREKIGKLGEKRKQLKEEIAKAKKVYYESYTDTTEQHFNRWMKIDSKEKELKSIEKEWNRLRNLPTKSESEEKIWEIKEKENKLKLNKWTTAINKRILEIEKIKSPEERLKLAIESEKEFNKTKDTEWVLPESIFAKVKVEAKREIRKKEQKSERPIWERSYTPFTKEQIEDYNRYTHYPLDINEDYKKAITSIENDVKKKLNLKDLKNAPEDIKKALDYCKKFYYQYYLATSRSRQIAPSWSVVGRTKYKGNVERANKIERKASDDLQKSKKILESKVYNAIKDIKWKQPKTFDFGENNKTINKEIRDFRKKYDDIEIIQTASGSRTGKKWKLFDIKNKKNNKRYQIEISEDGSIDFTHFFGGRIATIDTTSLNQFQINLNKIGTQITKTIAKPKLREKTTKLKPKSPKPRAKPELKKKNLERKILLEFGEDYEKWGEFEHSRFDAKFLQELFKLKNPPNYILERMTKKGILEKVKTFEHGSYRNFYTLSKKGQNEYYDIKGYLLKPSKPRPKIQQKREYFNEEKFSELSSTIQELREDIESIEKDLARAKNPTYREALSKEIKDRKNEMESNMKEWNRIMELEVK